jgi:hypothetical protein
MMATKTRRKPFGEVEPYKVKSKKPPVTQSSSGRYRGPGTPKMREEFEATLAAERREAEAKASKAERDPQPNQPKGSSKVDVGKKLAPKALGKLNRRMSRFLRFGTANPRQVLMLELIAVLTVVTVDQLAHKQAPTPKAYVAPFIVYLVLGFMAEIGGDGGARVATGIGLLVLVALVLANAPGIVTGLQVATGQRQAPVEGVG